VTGSLDSALGKSPGCLPAEVSPCRRPDNATMAMQPAPTFRPVVASEKAIGIRRRTIRITSGAGKPRKNSM